MITKFPPLKLDQYTQTAALGLVVWLAASPLLDAATLVVTSVADSGAGSLREAATSASAGDTIEFSVTGTITLTGGELVLDRSLVVAGPGATNLIISGNGASRLFNVASGVTVSISGLTLADGLADDGQGGAILNSGTLNLSQCTISNCLARATFETDALGGAIYTGNGSVLTIVDCLLVANRALGGSLYYFDFDCGAGLGGAIYNDVGTLMVTNSTFSANRAEGGSYDNETWRRMGDALGGAIYTLVSDTFLMNCTIVSNTAAAGTGGGVLAEAHGGGVYSDSDDGGYLSLKNTIIAGNDAISSYYATTNLDVGGAFLSLGHNLIGSGDESVGLTNAANGDQVGSGGSPIDPLVGALADNGGPTFTHALLTNSTAIDAGDNAGITATDQRGLPRMVGVAVDIGAFEVQDVNIAPVADPQTITGLEDTDLVIALTGSDADNDPLTVQLTSLPGVGALYQYNAGNRGTAITSAPAAVADAQWRLIFAPPADANGSPFTTFDFIVNDGTVDSLPATVTVNVTPVNDPPSFTKGPDQTVNEDAGPQTVAGWATALSPGPPDESAQQLTFFTSNTNNALFAAQPAISTNGTLTYTPAPDASGVALVTVWLQDDGGTNNGGLDTSATQTFLITIVPVNDPPSFIQGPDQIVNEDSGPHMVSGWVTSMSRGPADEITQSLTFQVSNNNNPLFSTQPSISTNGTLTFTSAPDAFGLATVTVILRDNGGTANGGVDTSLPVTFTITVRPVNDPPSFVKGPDQLVNQNAGPQSVPGWATSLSIGPTNEAGQVISFLVGSDNAALFAVPPAIASTGTLSYTPAPDASGIALVTVRAQDDGGTLFGGIDTSAPQTFTITVNAPPVVWVIDPTNGTVFIAPATFPVVAEASDPDGWVTNVLVFAETNLLGEAPTNLCFAVWSNVMAGTYALSAQATDNLGLSANSAIVTITVLDGPPFEVGPLVLNRQTGLFEQTVRLSNPSPLPIVAVQLAITNPLPPGVWLWNASGTNAGQVFVQHDSPVPALGWVDFHLEYYLTNRPAVTNLTDAAGVFNPGYRARLVPPAAPPNPPVTNTIPVTPIVLTNGNFLVEFSTEASRFYYVQYSGDLTNWRTAVPAVIGVGSRVQWIDSGPPKTESPPSSVPSRFYRFIQLP